MLQNSNQVNITSEIYLFSSEKSTAIVTFEPKAEGAIGSTHLLIGIGVIICLFLFIIIIQLCYKTKTTKRETLMRDRCSENMIQNEPQIQIETREETQEMDNVNLEQYKQCHFYRTLVIDEAGVDVCLENNSPISHSSKSYERPISSSRNLPPNCGTKFTDFHDNSNSIEQPLNESKLSACTSNYYLSPIFDPEKNFVEQP